MLLYAGKIIKILELTKDKGMQRLMRNIIIFSLSPIIAFVFLVGGIYTDGINFNHNLVNDLFNGVPVETTNMDPAQRDLINEIERNIPLLNQRIDEENSQLEDGESLDVYLIKGFYIGIMFSSQSLHLNQETADKWTKCFVQNDDALPDEIKKYPERDASKIFLSIEKNMNFNLNQDTKQSMLKVVEGLRGGMTTSGTVTTLSQEEIEKLVKNLPIGTTELRKQIVIQAADAVGKIPYYWGGVASYPGYEGNDFGKPITPDEHGRALKGMDCSHFVDWVYWTVMNNNLGNTNTEGQLTQCKKITMSELKPGDLAFLIEGGVSTHVGIYAGKKETGELVWIHENAGDNNVSMNTVSYWNLYCRLNIMDGK